MSKGWLTPSESRRLTRVVASLLPLGKTYHVGSSVYPTEGRTPRDIDLRLMLDDEVYDALAPGQWTVISDHIGRSLEVESGVERIDFQIQSVTAANVEHAGIRSAIFLLPPTEGEAP